MIEINRAGSIYIYKINEYAPTEIDYRKNRHYARWYFHSRYHSAQEAVAALMMLEKPTDAPRGTDGGAE